MLGRGWEMTKEGHAADNQADVLSSQRGGQGQAIDAARMVGGNQERSIGRNGMRRPNQNGFGQTRQETAGRVREPMRGDDLVKGEGPTGETAEGRSHRRSEQRPQQRAMLSAKGGENLAS